MEILAPAGGMESLIAAVRCGADAVYLGLGKLNARRSAQNFDAQLLLDAARYCGERGVKIHVALNTLVFDDEMEEAAQCLRAACAAGVEALIVQDLAVWGLARASAPSLRLHASTQMAVHDAQGARQLHEMGFSRAVLARELSCGEIAAVCRCTPMETEVFVHGALCVSMSGRCLLSAMAGGRSGNRGMCAQPCRLPMAAPGDSGGGYALSLKDLSLLEPAKLAALKAAGVCSLKIEGRMKRPEYVAAAVTAAKTALAGGKPDLDLLRGVFSRSGFTDGYFSDPGAGRGARFGKDMFGVRTREDVLSAREALAACAKLYEKEAGRVPLHFAFRLRAGDKASLTARDEDGHCVRVSGPAPQAAVSRAAAREDIIRSLSKLGGSCYRAMGFSCEMGEGLAFPASAVNAMRREAVEKISEERGRLRPVPYTGMGGAPARERRADPPGPPRLRAALMRAEQFSRGLLESCEVAALYPGALARVLAQGADPRRLAVREPPAHFDGGAFEEALPQLRAAGVQRLLACGLSGIRTGRAQGFEVMGDFGLNIANTAALREYGNLGLQDSMVSAELSAGRVARLGGGLPRGIAAYGRLPLMALRACPVRCGAGCARCQKGAGVLRDRQGRRFRVSCAAGGGVSQMYNSDTLYLADKAGGMRGVDFLWLFFTDETGAEALRTVECYARHSGPQELLGDAPFTRGLYFRKVL